MSSQCSALPPLVMLARRWYLSRRRLESLSAVEAGSTSEYTQCEPAENKNYTSWLRIGNGKGRVSIWVLLLLRKYSTKMHCYTSIQVRIHGIKNKKTHTYPSINFLPPLTNVTRFSLSGHTCRVKWETQVAGRAAASPWFPSQLSYVVACTGKDVWAAWVTFEGKPRVRRHSRHTDSRHRPIERRLHL